MSSIWNAVSKYLPFGGRRLIGKDLAGNKYYEYPNPTGGRARRVIKYRFMSHMADYTSGKHRLPIQWTAWLAYTRANPPSMAELQQDAARQSTLVNRVADIESREREERIRQGYITSGEQPPDVHSSLPYGAPSTRRIRSGPSFSPPVSSSTSRLPQIERKAPRIDSPTPAEQPMPDSHRYDVPTPPSPGVPPPPQTVDPAQHSTKDDLRRLAEEDTKRRIAEQGGHLETKDTGVQGVGAGTGAGGLKPRRRGGQ